MKFFSKYKKQIFSVFLCVVLLSCFIGFSLFSSADVVNDVTPVSPSSAFFEINPNYSSQFGTGSYLQPVGNGYRFLNDYGISTPTEMFSYFAITFVGNYSIPEYTGRSLSLSFNIDLIVRDTGYLSFIPNNVDISDHAIFTDCGLFVIFADGTTANIAYDTFVLKDDDIGTVIDPNSDAYWESIKGNIMDLSIYALFDITPYSEREIVSVYAIFPGPIYYSNDDLNNFLYIEDIAATFDFAYMPFNDVVQDDLTNIKGSLSDVHNKLDSLFSSMNTIDQDVNRVNQKLDQTNETLGDINQGIQDILKPSAPAVDFKNQWNDYFSDNPIPDLSALPFYDMSNMMTLLADSSSIIRNIFSPFFLRDYSVLIPLTQGFANVRLDPVATYVSLSIGLSLAVVIIGLLKGGRG